MTLIFLAPFIFMGQFWFQFAMVILVKSSAGSAPLCWACPSHSNHPCSPLPAVQTFVLFYIQCVPQKGLGKRPGPDSVLHVRVLCFETNFEYGGVVHWGNSSRASLEIKHFPLVIIWEKEQGSVFSIQASW